MGEHIKVKRKNADMAIKIMKKLNERYKETGMGQLEYMGYRWALEDLELIKEEKNDEIYTQKSRRENLSDLDGPGRRFQFEKPGRGAICFWRPGQQAGTPGGPGREKRKALISANMSAGYSCRAGKKKQL